MLRQGERFEFSFWEAGCLIWVGSQDLGGLSYGDFCDLIWGKNPEKSRQFILEKKAFMPMNLYQDDGYSIRVMMGELNEQEQDEWVARVRWKLDLTCGKLVVSGVADEEEEAFKEMPPVTQLEEVSNNFQCYVEVTPGEYQVEIYSYAPGDLSTGWGQIVSPQLFPPTSGIEPESLKDYFHRTRTESEIPPWIAYEICDDKLKTLAAYQAARDISYLDFIVRLCDCEENLNVPNVGTDGCLIWEFRKPNRCPLGIERAKI